MTIETILNKLTKEINIKNINYHNTIEEVIKVFLLQKNTNKQIVVVKDNAYNANIFYERIKGFIDEEKIILYNPEESLRTKEISAVFEYKPYELNALNKIIQNKYQILITTTYAITRHLEFEEIKKHRINLKVDDNISKEKLVDLLSESGYEKTQFIENPMSYASRGYIVDVYSVNYDNPIRIEFFDDVIESIRSFDINTKETIEKLKEVEITFARDFYFSEKEKENLSKNIEIKSGEIELDLEYILKDAYQERQYIYYSLFEHNCILEYLKDHIIYISDINASLEHEKYYLNDVIEYIQEECEENKIIKHFDLNLNLQRTINKYPHLEGKVEIYDNALIEEIYFPDNPLNISVDVIINNKAKYKYIVLERKLLKILQEYLDKQNIKYSLNKDDDGLILMEGLLNVGFEVSKYDLIVYTANELFKENTKANKYFKQYKQAQILDSYNDIEKGDFVVHDKYGIALFDGIVTKTRQDISQDYLKLVFASDQELYVPLHYFTLVRKYNSKDGVKPSLSSINSTKWAKTVNKIKNNINELADKLVDLYSARCVNKGFAFSKDSDKTRKFASEFPFSLTQDQQKAIAEITFDMEQDTSMDRLLCGDVGFGKTEVAIRAAFKAIQDHKQVAYLCPTTILSMQHLNTFKRRFQTVDCSIEILNRFVSNKKVKEVIKNLKEGKIDIIIGTHRLLSKDIQFKDLGLLIIDEEQRFGVGHKEKIKQLKINVDVLSLSATPIPRTLQMSLIGIRTLSTLNTPPSNRFAVKTYVVRRNFNLILEAISKELIRKGQVFYLLNNIEQLFTLKEQLLIKLPYARIDIVHGQLEKEKIEEIMVKFYQHEIDILLCTTIIETGIDIPNANTLIIENAHKFGLAQLYQIKGRIGRGNKEAYAYLMVPDVNLTEESSARLKAIKQFTKLGSGYKIAMSDLTIRGAGDLLGPKQSGFIEQIGLDMYLELLNKAILKKKGIAVEEEKEIRKIEINTNSSLPLNFSSYDGDKFDLYKNLNKIKNLKELDNYLEIIKQEYGNIDSMLKNLINKKKLELYLNDEILTDVRNINTNYISISVDKEISNNIDGVKLFDYVYSTFKDLNIKYINKQLVFEIRNNEEVISKTLDLIKCLDQFKQT